MAGIAIYILQGGFCLWSNHYIFVHSKQACMFQHSRSILSLVHPSIHCSSVDNQVSKFLYKNDTWPKFHVLVIEPLVRIKTWVLNFCTEWFCLNHSMFCIYINQKSLYLTDHILESRSFETKYRV